MIYLDTSALVKRYVAEAGAKMVRRMFLGTEPLATSALSYAEYFSALNRKRRENALSRAAYRELARAFEADWTRLQVVQLTESVLRSARRLLERHELRAGDAVQLASALAMAGSVAVRFASADRRLAAAAAQQGLPVLEEIL